MKVIDISINQIMFDGGTQSRAKLDFRTIAKYAKSMKNGETLVPVVLFFDGSKYWLADGFHRARAAIDAGLKAIPAEVRDGTRRDAILHSAIASSDGEQRRTKADKRKAISLILEDSEWSQWSDSEISERLKVEAHLVSSVREQLAKNNIGDKGNIPGSYQEIFSIDLPKAAEDSPKQEQLDIDIAVLITHETTITREAWKHELSQLSSAERAIILDPYYASPDIIADVIEKLKDYYKLKTGRDYI